MILDDLGKSLGASMETNLARVRGRFEKLVGQLDVLSPLATLSRGYSITSRIQDGRTVLSTDDVRTGEQIATLLLDGRIYSSITDIQRTDTTPIS
jgi:exodeoxyribonuclease VII large subunit